MDTAAGRILAVDDDTALLKLMNTYLARLGYGVDACRSAEDGWALVQADPSRYRLALVDLEMPGMGGRELALRILASNPSIRLVVVSGYPAELNELGGPDSHRVSFLRKPFAPRELAEAVK
jgi:DNA-binding response OmpR family regulator